MFGCKNMDVGWGSSVNTVSKSYCGTCMSFSTHIRPPPSRLHAQHSAAAPFSARSSADAAPAAPSRRIHNYAHSPPRTRLLLHPRRRPASAMTELRLPLAGLAWRSGDGVQVGWGGPLDLDGPSQPRSERNIPTLGWTQPTSFCNQTRVEVGRTHPNPLRPSNQTDPKWDARKRLGVG